MDKIIPKKIKRLPDLVRTIERLKKEGKKIVHCHGVFDLVHPGHIRHFQGARKYGDILVVTITADKYVHKGPGRPIFNQSLRAEVLSAIEYIDYIAIVYSDSAIGAIHQIKPHFYVKGSDYKNRKHVANIPRKIGDEEAAVASFGGKLIFTEDEIVFSSSRLINEYLDVYPSRTKKYLDTIRSNYGADYITDKLLGLAKLKILIVGDAIIDQYHYCLPMGKSSKEPVMVHQYISEESFAGGTLATANHVASLSQRITLLSLLGKKRSYKSFIEKHLKPSISPVFYYHPSWNTIVKRRYVDAFTKQKLFQISYLQDAMISKETEKQIIKYMKAEIKKYDMVIVNDFGHGLLTERIVKFISAKANYLALNVQANSANYGFNIITKYPKADFVCIDEQEIRLATHNKHGDLSNLIKKVYTKMKCKRMIITRGPEGLISYTAGEGFHEAPALTDKFIDRVGAGDALFAFSAPCVYGDLGSDIVSFVGNVAGALKLQIVGNRSPVEFVDIVKFMTRLLK